MTTTRRQFLESTAAALVNGILWSAGLDVPREGAPVAVSEADLALPPQQPKKK